MIRDDYGVPTSTTFKTIVELRNGKLVIGSGTDANRRSISWLLIDDLD
jgi:hypothetical protein